MKLDISEFLQEVVGRQNALAGRCLPTPGLAFVAREQVL